MQKMIEIYLNKDIYLLKQVCKPSTLRKICLHMYKLVPFVEADKDLLDKLQETMTGGPSLVFKIKKYQLVFTNDGSLTNIVKNSKLETTNSKHMTTRTCLPSNRNIRNAL